MHAQATPKRKRRIPLWAKITMGAVVALAALIASPHIYYGLAVRAELKRIGAAGEPASLADLDAFYPTPTGRNAADVLDRAFKAYVSWKADDRLPIVGDVRPPPRGTRYAPGLLRRVRAYVARNSRALALLHRGALMRQCRYPIRLADGFNAELPHLADSRHGCRLLELEAITHAHDGDALSAATDLRRQFGLARSYTNEPMIISQLVRIAIDAIAQQSLERCLSLTPLADFDLRMLSRVVRQEEEGLGGAMKRAYLSERCIEWSAFDDPTMIQDLAGAQFLGVRLPAPVFRALGLVTADRYSFLLMWRRIIPLFDLPLASRARQSADMEGRMYDLPPIRRPILRLSAAAARVFEEEMKHVAAMRATRVGLAIERYRLAKGRLPESLGQLVPGWLDSVPIDPYTDKPLLYLKRKVGYVVYSVGPNGKDDRGVERHDWTNSDYDVTFTVSR